MTYQEQLQEQQEEYEEKLNNLFSIQPVPAKDTLSLQNLSKQKQEYLKNVTLQSYLQSQKLQKMFSPFSDTDKDTFVNIFDCYPFDPNRHGIGSWLRRVGEKVGIVKPKPTPTPTTPSQEKAKRELFKKAGIKEPSTPLHKALKEAEKRRTIRRGGGGYSRIRGGKKEYVLPSGEVVEATPETTMAITKGAETKEEIKKLTEAQKLAPKVKKEVKAGVIAPYEPKGLLEKAEAK